MNTELAALFAGLMTKVGIYALIRVMTLLFDHQPDITHQLMYYMAIITMIIGAVGVLGYDDVKKIAAYQVILSIGFSVLGLSTLNEAGVTGAIFYAGHDMIIKTLLFLVLGVFVVQCGSRSYKNMGGLIHVHPSLGIIFFILTLSIGGVPPFSGFPGKVLITQGAMEKGYVIGVIVLVITSIIAMYSLLRIFFIMYFAQEEVPQVNKVPLAMHKIIAMLFLTGATIFMGICGEWFLDFARQAAEFNLHPSEYIKAVIPDVKVEVD